MVVDVGMNLESEFKEVKKVSLDYSLGLCICLY